MEENKQGYDPSEFEDDDYMASQPVPEKSIRGYRIVIIILSVILVALSVLYFSIHRQQMVDNQLLQADRDSIQNDLGRLMTDYDNLQVTNDSISANLNVERDRADSLMTRLKKERSWNLAKIKQYEKEVGTLRTVMKSYIRQIDSLNTLNKKLINENVTYRKEISSAKLRAEMADTPVKFVLIEPGPIGTRIRLNSIPHFERWIDWQSSPRRAQYEATLLQRLYHPAAKKDRFELPPRAVSERIALALESPNPRPRYYVTTPTHVSGLGRRILSTRALDWFARRG